MIVSRITRIMYLRRSTTIKYFISVLVGAAFYSEWLVYLLQPLYWTSLECNENDFTCTKILFIADPQIQGDMAVLSPLNHILNWDSDRYLSSTFSVVVKQFKPHVLVFLGDLMDEGSISTMVQFHQYVKRLASIFEVDYQVTQVWIPGDNDIGGEDEPIRYDKLEAFEKTFQQPSVIHYGNVSFYKVNAITNKYPHINEDDMNENNFKIAISHYPVTSRQKFGSMVLNAIHPKIFFCAHDHESKYVKQTKDLRRRTTTWFNTPRSVLSITFSNDMLVEIYVPTCSYRMGTSNIGYGAAVLDNNNERMRYTVFWSSTRFPYLIIYLILLVLLFMYFIVFCAARVLHRQTKSFVTADMSPLLQKA